MKYLDFWSEHLKCFSLSRSQQNLQLYLRLFLGEQQSEEIFRLLTLLSPFAGEVVSIILMIMRRTMMAIAIAKKLFETVIIIIPTASSLCNFHKGLWAEGEHRRCFGENLWDRRTKRGGGSQVKNNLGSDDFWKIPENDLELVTNSCPSSWS